MKEYSGLLPQWAIVPWIPLNIYVTYQIFATAYGVGNIGYALPVIFIIGFVGSALTFLLLDFLLWRILIKLRGAFSASATEQDTGLNYRNSESSGHGDTGENQTATGSNPANETFRLSDEYDPDPKVRASFKQSRRNKRGRVVKVVLATLFVIWIVQFLILNRHHLL